MFCFYIQDESQMNSYPPNTEAAGRMLTTGDVTGEILVCSEGLSFWGGVDPETGAIIDIHHPCHQKIISGKILMMPSSRGSCSGSGVLLELSFKNIAPAAIIFCEAEEILSLGALVSNCIFNKPIPVARLTKEQYSALAAAKSATLKGNKITTDSDSFELKLIEPNDLRLTDKDREYLEGKHGSATKMAMQIICLMAAANDTTTLIDIQKGHVDGCILAHSANLIFAEKMAELGAQVSVPTTINAISVDRENWLSQKIPEDFGNRASRLADAYVKMGAKPVFTCAPYLLEEKPKFGEIIGWSESNAVIYANSILGARTSKNPDYLDLFIAMTGRAPESGVYTDDGRMAQEIISVEIPDIEPDDVFWPLIGWLAGKASPIKIPIITGLENLNPEPDDLKSLCAAFGTTSGAPMLHISGQTPEAKLPLEPTPATKIIDLESITQAWYELNKADTSIDLVAIGSPHASFEEVKKISRYFSGRKCHSNTSMIITVGRHTLALLKQAKIYHTLIQSGVQVVADICWCSITEPVLPPQARHIITNSGKYAHYAYGLSGRHARLASLRDCVEAAVSGIAPKTPPSWLKT